MPFLSSGETRTGTINGGFPLYVPNSGNSLAGVLSLNGQTGVVSVTSSDSSITVTPGGGSVALSTTGNALTPSTVTASGGVSVGGALTVSGTSALQATSVASLTSSGAVSGTSFANSTSPTVSYTSASYPSTSPPPTGAALITNGYNPTNVVIDVTPLASFKSLAVRVLGGNFVNNASGGGQGQAVFAWSDLTANPGSGAAFQPQVWAEPNVTNAIQSGGIIANNGSVIALQTYAPPTSGSSPNAFNIFQTVVIPYPTSGSLILWGNALASAGHLWLDSLQVQITGVL